MPSMISVRGLILVILRTAFIVAFLSIPKPVVAITGIKNWSKKAIHHKIGPCKACYSQIIPGLYLSKERADKNVLRRLNITHVLTVAKHHHSKNTFQNTDISTLYIRAYDTPQTDLLPYFPMANAFIDEGLQKGNVLVQCHSGISRSSTLVIAYIMEKRKLTFEQSLMYVRQRRRSIKPNPGFVSQLRKYEELLKYEGLL